MAKFKVSLKLQGLEVSIEGEKDDIPALTRGISNQLTGLLAPAIGAATGVSGHQEGEPPAPPTTASASPPAALEMVQEVRRKGSRKPSSKRSAPATETVSTVVDWPHDPTKFGNPLQTWKTSDKAIWLLYVVANQTSHKDLSARGIADTFNKHFRQSGTILTFNINRDLGKAKTKAGPAVVGEDTTRNPSAWYLTDAGEAYAQSLVAKALGRTE
ncbi:hypothetical protein ACFJIX_05820 [Roseateles sp. UC29_93]|uniref:hypothetical protein n=1 Tax=Roseateles sp. UC29_93 TaxID=3350177 RepID=UPI00366CA6E8